jgi:hypothetical protein
MRRTTRTAAVLALGILAVGAPEAAAAWNNVFQTTCCGKSTRSAYFAPAPPPACCPTVNYVQRTYYQPVTTYKTETYYEPVTTYRTSYYWEPVTTYRYTSYYDPCTGCCQRVAKPCTTYYQRARCNAVQSYVQRCRTVPVTEMRKSCYLEPVVTYSNCCDPCAPGATAAATAPPAGVREDDDPPARIPGAGAGVEESAEPKRIPPTKIEPGSRKVTPVPTGPVRTDRIAKQTNSGRLRGQVVRDDRITPRSNAMLKFVGAKDEQVVAKADPAGRFAVQLPPGEWTLYVPGQDGKATFHSTLVVRKTDDRTVTVVSR